MTKSVAIQMDPIWTVDINGDSTFALALEAQKRGYSLFHYHPFDISWRDGKVTARGQAMTLRREAGNHYSLGETEIVDLSTFDVILMRQDPPFDMSYITATHILEHIHPKTLVVNDPVSVRNAPEKLFVTLFPELMPPTLISRNRADIIAFREEYKDIIVKPLFGNGGAGVFHLKPGDENLISLLEMFEGNSREPVMAQQYLPDVRKGDKRIILVDGEAVGAIDRIPAEGEARSNMHVGGRPVQAGLSKRDKEICEAIGPVLREQGQIFVGIDVIGGNLTEINVTSPTGIQEIDRYDNVDLSALVWNAIERRL
tara:strand:+ start:19706 stop:20644 length:939 start_codon:yes stop_codon:yes gene_type:complete